MDRSILVMIIFFIFTVNSSAIPKDDDDINAERMIFDEILKQVLSENDYSSFDSINSRRLKDGNYKTIKEYEYFDIRISF